MNHNSNEEQTLTRRQALKTLAAVTGAVSLASLPTQWAAPVIEVGALPAHAQSSLNATIRVVNNGTDPGTARILLGATVVGGPAQINGGNQRDFSVAPIVSVTGVNSAVICANGYRVDWSCALGDAGVDGQGSPEYCPAPGELVEVFVSCPDD